ncbi:MAG: D-alanyl-D-alanine carboxypeptidase [Armatimonadetes bacterium]|nr:D-alanyl-D-alanine carboxypeptidase [Candidatus Hippobium faecium]
MKKIIYLIFIFILMSLAAYSMPECNSPAYICTLADSGQVLYEKNADRKLPIASLTKIMTAIVYLEKCDKSKPVVYTKEASHTESANMFFPIGTKLTPDDALRGMLIGSSNDLAVAIARSTVGEETFVAYMNEKAQTIGMKNTHFANVHGLDDPKAYSTCEDMALLVRYALRVPGFMDCIAPEYVIHADNKGKDFIRRVYSTFRNFYSFRGLKGIKTGTTSKAKKCFAGYTDRNSVPLVTIILGSGDAIKDTRALVNYTYRNCEKRTVAFRDRYYSVTYKGTKITMNPKEDVAVYMDRDREPETKITVTEKFPFWKGKKVGELIVTDNGREIRRANFYSEKFILWPSVCTKILKAVIVILVILFILKIIMHNLGSRPRRKKQPKRDLPHTPTPRHIPRIQRERRDQNDRNRKR